MRTWVVKKITEYIGEEEPTLVDFICEKVTFILIDSSDISKIILNFYINMLFILNTILLITFVQVKEHNSPVSIVKDLEMVSTETI